MPHKETRYDISTMATVSTPRGCSSFTRQVSVVSGPDRGWTRAAPASRRPGAPRRLGAAHRR
jgi:hypothetical protein